MASDTRLVAWVREGRVAAFEALYDRHQKPILSFCHHMLGSLEEAEDAVQHTFLAAYNGLAGSQRPIHLRAWLFTIARNRCYSMLRKRREQPLEELGDATTEGVATLVQRRQDLRDLVRDMGRLPDNQRAALVLAEMDALSHEQIGVVLGVPTPKVKALVFQARESLLASRSAREADCTEIREQLANLRGGALRRTQLRRHLRDCSGCREFRKQIDRQRRQLALLLPVAPTIAIKQTLLSTTGGGAAATGGIAGSGLVASGGLKGVTLIGAVLAAIGAAGTIVAVPGITHVSSAPTAPNHSLVASDAKLAAPRAADTDGSAGAAAAPAAAWGHSISSITPAVKALAFSPSHRLVAKAGHGRGSSSRLLVASLKPGAGSTGQTHYLAPAGTGAAGSRKFASIPSAPGGSDARHQHTAFGSTSRSDASSTGFNASAPSSDSNSGPSWPSQQRSGAAAPSVSSPSVSPPSSSSPSTPSSVGHNWPGSGSGRYSPSAPGSSTGGRGHSGQGGSSSRGQGGGDASGRGGPHPH